MKSYQARKRLNAGLDSDRLTVRVSKDHELLLSEYEPEPKCAAACKGDKDCLAKCRLKAYLISLGFCPKGIQDEYCLWGPYAVEHARRVHARIRRQVLRYKDVSAVDVGFAVKEGDKEFENLLAIRIHVARKHQVGFLMREGLPDFTDPRHAVRAVRYRKEPRVVNWKFPIPGVSPWDVGFLPPRTGPAEADGETDKHCCCCYWSCEKCCECCCYCRCEHKTKPKCKKEGCGKTISCAARTDDSDSSRHSDCCCCCCWCDRITIDGVPLDVIEANYFPSANHPGGDYSDGVFVDPLAGSDKIQNEELLLTGRGRVSPLVGGISCGSVSSQAGTLAAIVWDETDGSPCVLGNWHVLAGSASARVGQRCYQPALFDGGTPDDVIGHLKRWHLGELGDAAIAELDGSRSFTSGEILGMWHPISGYQAPALNLEVRKWGRTTGFTEGFIDGIDLATNIDYGGGFVRHFEKQFHIAPLYPGEDVSQIGDSGSLVLTYYDLDDLDMIARGMLRWDPKSLVKALRELVGAKLEDAEELARLVAKELARPEHQPPVCVGDGPSLDCATSAMKVTEGLRALREHASKNEPLDKDGRITADDLRALIKDVITDSGVDLEKTLAEKKDREHRRARNVYYAVGLIFAGDTPGSPFGEFALASDVGLLAKDLRFSLRPVFEPRSSFRKLRSRPPGRTGRGRDRLGRSREPGEQTDDPRGQGPQPEGEEIQGGGPGGNSPGGGG